MSKLIVTGCSGNILGENMKYSEGKYSGRWDVGGKYWETGTKLLPPVCRLPIVGNMNCQACSSKGRGHKGIAQILDGSTPFRSFLGVFSLIAQQLFLEENGTQSPNLSPKSRNSTSKLAKFTSTSFPNIFYRTQVLDFIILGLVFLGFCIPGIKILGLRIPGLRILCMD